MHSSVKRLLFKVGEMVASRFDEELCNSPQIPGDKNHERREGEDSWCLACRDAPRPAHAGESPGFWPERLGLHHTHCRTLRPLMRGMVCGCVAAPAHSFAAFDAPIRSLEILADRPFASVVDPLRLARVPFIIVPALPLATDVERFM